MGDYDQSSGCLGSIISAVLLIFLWPYIVAVIGIYLAYLVLLEVTAWLASNWLWVGGFLCVAFVLYLAIHLRLIAHIFSWVSSKQLRSSFKKVEFPLEISPIASGDRTFTPSTDLYCYWCTKKLGLQSWERSGKYYCHSCYESICNKDRLKS